MKGLDLFSQKKKKKKRPQKFVFYDVCSYTLSAILLNALTEIENGRTPVEAVIYQPNVYKTRVKTK